MKKIANIGIFDSGVGGLSVLKSIKQGLKFNNIIYYGDNARVPYGSKSKDTIIKFSLEALEFFNNFDIDLLIIACNTASAYALDSLKQQSKVPVVGVIESGILSTTKKSLKQDTILITATNATIKSNLYKMGLENLGYKNIISIGANLLVGLVEEKIYSGELVDACFKYYFDGLEKKIDSVVLGCTHFPLLIDSFKKYFGSCNFIHSGEAMVEYLQDNFNIENKGKNNISFYASGDLKNLKDTASLWLDH